MQKLSKLTAAFFLICFSVAVAFSSCTNGEDKSKEPEKKMDTVPAKKLDTTNNPKPTSTGG